MPLCVTFRATIQHFGGGGVPNLLLQEDQGSVGTEGVAPVCLVPWLAPHPACTERPRERERERFRERERERLHTHTHTARACVTGVCVPAWLCVSVYVSLWVYLPPSLPPPTFVGLALHDVVSAALLEFG
eukprot:2070323-Rhodomonas_salina.1